MFDDVIRRLDDLDGMVVKIAAKGRYPVKARTLVQNVAKWQNDGTERIKPAKFVEMAEGRHLRMWLFLLAQGAFELVFDGEDRGIRKAGWTMAEDINKAVNRIDTGRLRESFRAIVEK